MTTQAEAASRLTHRHRGQQLLLRQATATQVQKLWPMLDPTDLDASYQQFAGSLSVLIERNRQTSAGLTAQYLRTYRDMSGIPGAAKIIVPQGMNVEQFTTSLRSTSVAAAKIATGNGDPLDVAMQKALTQTQGSMGRLVLGAGRETMMGTIQADSAATGFSRILGGGGCDFCRMLAGRGAVYKEDTADFEAHDHCGCTGQPEYDSSVPRLAQRVDVPESLQRLREANASVPATVVDEAVPATFAPEDLRSALDPSRKRTASAVKADLEKTPAGRDLAAAIKGFTETRGGVANLRKNIEKTIDGTAGEAAKARAKAFLDALNAYPAGDVPTLFRGFAVKVEENTNAWWDAFEGQFQPGQRISLNASSFTSNEKKAAEFEKMIGGTRKAGSNHTAVRYVLEENAHALPVEQLSKFKSEKEWMSGGEFEVVGYQPATPKQPYYRVVIRQVKSLEAPR